MNPLAALLLSIAIALSSSTASAQSDEADDEARVHFEAGNLHFNRGAYEEAHFEFHAAFELSGRAELLYNLFLTSERLADFDQAVMYLERYLDEGAPDAERRASLEPRLDNLRHRQERMASEQGAEGAVTSPSEESGNMVPALVAFSIAGAGLVTFAVAGGLALSEDNALTSSCGTACTDEEVSSLGTRTLVADIGWVTAIAAAAVGAVLVFTVGRGSSDGSSESSNVNLSSWVLPSGGGISAQGEF